MFALEFVLSMVECSPEMMRKHMGLMEGVMRTAAEFSSAMDDDPEWHKKDDDLNGLQGIVTGDEGAMAALGDDTLDRLARALGGRLMVELFDGRRLSAHDHRPLFC